MSIIYFSGVGPWLLFNSQNGPGPQKGLGTSALGDVHEPTPFKIVKVLTLKSPQRCASCEAADRSFLGVLQAGKGRQVTTQKPFCVCLSGNLPKEISEDTDLNLQGISKLPRSPSI